MVWASTCIKGRRLEEKNRSGEKGPAFVERDRESPEKKRKGHKSQCKEQFQVVMAQTFLHHGINSL